MKDGLEDPEEESAPLDDDDREYPFGDDDDYKIVNYFASAVE